MTPPEDSGMSGHAQPPEGIDAHRVPRIVGWLREAAGQLRHRAQDFEGTGAGAWAAHEVAAMEEHAAWLVGLSTTAQAVTAPPPSVLRTSAPEEFRSALEAERRETAAWKGYAEAHAIDAVRYREAVAHAAEMADNRAPDIYAIRGFLRRALRAPPQADAKAIPSPAAQAPPPEEWLGGVQTRLNAAEARAEAAEKERESARARAWEKDQGWMRCQCTVSDLQARLAAAQAEAGRMREVIEKVLKRVDDSKWRDRGHVCWHRDTAEAVSHICRAALSPGESSGKGEA